MIDSDGGASSVLVTDLNRVVGRSLLGIEPVESKGMANDLLALMRSEIDLAILQSNVWQSLPNNLVRSQARERLQYIAGLYSKDLHILAPREVNEIRELHQRRVNIGPRGSGTNWTARQLFAHLGIEPVYVENDDSVALEKLREEQLDAAVQLERHPSATLTAFPTDARFHLVPVRYDEEVPEGFLPGRLEGEDYPNLMEKDAHVETVAIRTVLAVANVSAASTTHWQLHRFTSRFFALISELVKDGDPTWADVQPSVAVDGWRRFKPAEEILKRGRLTDNQQDSSGQAVGDSDERVQHRQR